MGNLRRIFDMLHKEQIIYLKDDYYEAALRIDGSKFYIKYKGREEEQISYVADIVYQIEHGGEFISKEEYENY